MVYALEWDLKSTVQFFNPISDTSCSYDLKRCNNPRILKKPVASCYCGRSLNPSQWRQMWSHANWMC